MSVSGASSAVRGRCTLVLENPYSEWFCSQSDGMGPTVQSQGYAFVGDKYVEGQDFADFVRAECSVDCSLEAVQQVRKLIPVLNGAWALAVQWPDGHLLAATDRMRSIPLFFALLPSAFVLACSVDQVLSRCESTEIDEKCAAEFLLAGYVTGNETLWKGIHQMQSGEIIEYCRRDGRPDLSATRYYRFLPSSYHGSTEYELEERLASVLDGIFGRFVSALSGRRVIVPLSGGLDSRLIVALLKRHGFEDVLCFSYGIRGNEESRISKEVADALGYEWRFFEYDGNVWARTMGSESLLRYWDYSCNATSSPVQSNFPVLRALLGDCRNGGGAVFLPGHTADFLAGGHIPWELLDVAERAVARPVVEQAIFRHHYNLWPVSTQHLMRSYLAPLMEKIARLSAASSCGAQGLWPVARHEMWEAESRQAVFILNSDRAYEFVGGEWRIPLWDYALVDFLINVPLELRLQKRLYINTLRESVFIGKASDLAKIPLAGTRDWSRRVSGVSQNYLLWQRLKVLAKDTFRALGLLNTVKELRTREQPGHPLAFDTWFANGGDPRSLSVRDALKPRHVLEHLPSNLVRLIGPSLDERLDLIYHKALLAAVVLARYYESVSGS